jgi:hypothetical protein
MGEDAVDGVGAPATGPPRIWSWKIVAALLLLWASAGLVMDGEDAVGHTVPWLVILGGGVADERLELACKLYAEGHGRQGIVLTGRDAPRGRSDRAARLRRCKVPDELVQRWPTTADTFEEFSALATMLAVNPGAEAIVVSDALHMPRLVYLRDRWALDGRVFFRQSHLGGRADPEYVAKVAVFWLREPLAYIYYRLRY